MRLQLNGPYTLFLILVAVGTLLGLPAALTVPAVAAAQRGQPPPCGLPWPALLLLNLGCLLVLGAALFRLRTDARTMLDAEGISRPGLFGARRIRWAETTSVGMAGSGLRIVGSDTQIVLPIYVYREPGAVIDWIVARVKEARGL